MEKRWTSPLEMTRMRDILTETYKSRRGWVSVDVERIIPFAGGYRTSRSLFKNKGLAI